MIAPYELKRTGGVERYILSFCEAASKEVDLILFTQTNLGIQPYQVRSLERVLEDGNDFDLCISHAIYGTGPLPRARVYLHIFHGTILGNLLTRPWLSIHPSFLKWWFLEQRSLRGKDGIIGVSTQACKEIRWMGYRGDIRKIPSGGGFESERYEGEVKPGALRVIFCGRAQDKVKRFPWILEGFSLARAEIPDMELIVLGPGDADHGLEGVSFLGDLNPKEVDMELEKAHVQINASYYEGCSLSISEGILKAGLISLLTHRGGNKDMIKPGETGYFFNSPEELASILMDLGRDSQRRDSMIENIYQQGFKWSWERVCQEVLRFGRELLEAKS